MAIWASWTYDFSQVSVRAINGMVCFFICSWLSSSSRYATFHLALLWARGLKDCMFNSQMLECSASSEDEAEHGSGDDAESLLVVETWRSGFEEHDGGTVWSSADWRWAGRWQVCFFCMKQIWLSPWNSISGFIYINNFLCFYIFYITLTD